MKKLDFLGVSALLCAMAVPSMASAQDPVLYGYQGDMYGDEARGMFVFTPTGTTTDMLWRDKLAYNADGSINNLNMIGGWIREGRLCGYESYYPIPSLDYYKYVERDLETGEVLVEKTVNTDDKTNWGNIFLYAAYCPIDDRVYGFGFNKTRTKFVFKSAPATDLDQSTIIRVCEGNEFCKSVCFNQELGILVGINKAYELVQIDVNTGEQKLIYTPTLNPAPDYDIASGLIWLPSRQAYVWNFYTMQDEPIVSTLKLLDPYNNTARDLRSFPSGYNFTYFVSPEIELVADENGPAACTNLAAHFPGAATQGNFTFTLPTTLASGGALSGDVSYTLYIDDVQTFSGTGAAGSAVTTGNVTLTAGSHYVRVLPQNGAAKGLGELIAVFIGEDTPLAPTNVALTETTLSWDAVTKGLHGGVLDGVTYDVYINDKIIESDYTSTTLSMADIIDPADPLTYYQAEVRAKAGSKTSKGTLSNRIVAGESLSVPFTIEPTEAQFFMSIQEDTDGNNVGWSYDKRGYDDKYVFTSGFDKNSASEDWLFLPRFKAEANTIYTFSMNVNDADEEFSGGKVTVALGDAPSSDAMKVTLIPTMIINDYDPVRLTASFMIPEEIASAGSYYIGLGVKSDEGTLCPLQFENLRVVETSKNMDAPAAVSQLELKPVDNKPLRTIVKFVMPDVTLAGNSIPATHTVSAVVAASNGTSKTLTGAPGSAQEVEMEIGQGDFLITVTPKLNDISGMPANIVAHLGFALPGAVRNIRAEYNESNTFITIRWEAPLTDVEGNPSEEDILDYNVYSWNDDEGAFELAVTVPYPLTYATVNMSNVTTLTNLNVAVAAVNAVGESPYFERISCQVGTPYTLPMEDNLNGDVFNYNPMTWVKDGNGYDLADVKWGSASKFLTGEMAVADVGDVIMGIPSDEGARTRIIFPKFTTEFYGQVTLKFELWTGNDAAKMFIGATAYPMTDEKVLLNVPAGSGYETVNVPLGSDMVNNPWVAVSINAEYPSLNSRMVLAGYSFDGVKGVEGVSETLFGSIRGGENMIAIHGYESKTAMVFTMDGRLVKVEKLNDFANRIAIAPGMYIVKVADRSAKVVVR